jgi:RND family efflux transporter MFP subunit
MIIRRAAPPLAFIAAVAAFGACGGAGTEAQTQSGGGGRRGGGGGPAPVEVAPVETGTIARTVDVSGNIEPLRSVAVNAQLSGALREVNVEEGSRVVAGAVLARVDDREISAQLAAAQASFELAEATFERSEGLRAQQIITVAEYERDRAQLASSRASRDQLQTRLGYATVVAPISGVVTEKNVEAGDIVGVQNRLFTIAFVDTLVVRVQVSELDVVGLTRGATARLALDAFPGQPVIGTIRRIFPAADPTTRLVRVEVALTGADARLARPGFLARVNFVLGERRGVRLVPASAIVSNAAGSRFVYIVQGDHAERRVVETGMTSEGRVEIVQGLDGGEVVVVAGANALRDGAAIRVVNAAAGTVETAPESIGAGGSR